MPQKQSAIKELVLDVLKRFPNASKRGLARKLHAEYPQVFHSEEHARGHIKAYTGTGGLLLGETEK